MNTKHSNLIHWLTLACLILGTVFGLLFPHYAEKISFLGNIYVGLLKLIIVPLLMCQVFAAASRNGISTGKTILKAVIVFIILFAVTFLLTALILFVVQPGKGFLLPSEEWSGTAAEVEAGSILSNIFVTNIFQAMANGKLLPCVLFSLVLGVAAAILKLDAVTKVASELAEALSKVLNWIMYLTPVGVFSLMAASASTNGVSVISICLKYILVAWGCSIVMLFLVMILPVWIFNGITPGQYIRPMLKLWAVSLSTCSSMATLPTTLKVCKEEFNLPDKITSVIVPLGCTIHMCGGAVSFCLLATFTAQSVGIAITPGMLITMLLLAEVINMAAPGIPNGGVAIGAAYLAVLGLPLSFMGIYSGIYHLLDMIYTTLNVTGDVTANILICGKENHDA